MNKIKEVTSGLKKIVDFEWRFAGKYIYIIVTTSDSRVPSYS